MNFYYGLVDEQNHAYGFVEETDKRVKPGMVYVTEAEWSNLLNEQSAGKQIVFYDNRVFTAEPGLYFIDTNGVWQKKDTNKFQKEKRLQEIETELAKASSEYETLLETPVVYPANGFTYKPSYAKDDYSVLIGNYDTFSVETMPIEDSTHLASHTVNMTKDELQALALFLAQKQVEYRTVYSTKRATLLAEKEQLEKELEA